MRVDVVTLFPEMFAALTAQGVTGRAISRQILTLGYWNPRDFTRDVHRTVDDRPFGGGPGMVMQVEPVRAALREAKQAYTFAKSRRAIYLSPQGRTFDQAYAQELARCDHLVFLAGRYEGVDQRVLDTEIDEELSIGDFVLSGGELAAMVVIDTVARLLPGTLGHEDSAAQDSFAQGILDCPHYTRPEEIDGLRVPSVLLSGNHKEIARWRMKQALGRTWLKRPDLLEKVELDATQQALLDEFIREYEGN